MKVHQDFMGWSCMRLVCHGTPGAEGTRWDAAARLGTKWEYYIFLTLFACYRMGKIRLRTCYLGPPFIGMDYILDIAQILKVMLMVFPFAYLTLPRFFFHCSNIKLRRHWTYSLCNIYKMSEACSVALLQIWELLLILLQFEYERYINDVDINHKGFKVWQQHERALTNICDNFDKCIWHLGQIHVTTLTNTYNCF